MGDGVQRLQWVPSFIYNRFRELGSQGFNWEIERFEGDRRLWVIGWGRLEEAVGGG